MKRDGPPRSGTFAAAAVIVALGALLALFLQTAWLSDDAFITYRTIDNFLNGHGLRWNVRERVQAYTHPLWMMVVTAAVWPARNFVLVPLLLSVAVSFLAAALLAFRVAADRHAALLGLVLLGSSKAFVDYSTSGLENPLTHLLLVWLLRWHFAPADDPRRAPRLALAAGLVVLNRFDNAVMVAPVLLALVLERGLLASLGWIVLGFLPFAAWEAFSIVYYGFPFPNTAYAKLQTGIPPETLRPFGLHYLANSAIVDPLTLPLLLAASAVTLSRRDRRGFAVVAGIVFYLVYTVRIGGDFMSGRFLAAPFLMAVALVAQLRLAASDRLLAAAAGILLSLSSPASPLWLERDFGTRQIFPLGNQLQTDWWGVADERWVYFRSASLAHWRPGQTLPASFRVFGAATSVQQASVIEPGGAIGYYGFAAPRDRHIVDVYGLSDPLLARLPVYHPTRWRIGHFERALPRGYLETLGTGIDLIENPDVARYYRVLKLVTRGELWSWDRFVEIWRLNTGAYEHLLPQQ